MSHWLFIFDLLKFFFFFLRLMVFLALPMSDCHVTQPLSPQSRAPVTQGMFCKLVWWVEHQHWLSSPRGCWRHGNLSQRTRSLCSCATASQVLATYAPLPVPFLRLGTELSQLRPVITAPPARIDLKKGSLCVQGCMNAVYVLHIKPEVCYYAENLDDFNIFEHRKRGAALLLISWPTWAMRNLQSQPVY